MMANPTPKRLITSLRRWVRPDDWRRRLVFWGGAIATGTIAVAFATASTCAMRLSAQAHSAWPWWSFVATPLGLVLGVWATRKWFAGAEGSGIPQTIAVLARPSESARDRVLSLRIALGKILVTLPALASGATVSREGPAVQVGASIMHALRR